MGVTLCLQPISVSATHLFPASVPPIFTSIQVITTATFDLATGLYTYQYTLTNPATNTGEVFYIVIDIGIPASTLTLPSTGLQFDDGGRIDGSRIFTSFDDELKDWNDHPLRARQPKVQVVPVGTVIPEGGGNSYSGLTAYNAVVWHIDPPLIQGTSLGPFQVFSPGLPTIRSFETAPYYEPTVESEDDAVAVAEVMEVATSLTLTGKTIGPTAPPVLFDAQVFLETMRGYIAESQTLDWLSDPALAMTLTGYLDTVAAAISSGDTAGAELALASFIAALPVPPASTAACTSECAGLLVFNAQYILGQLTPQVPETCDGLDNNDDGSVDPSLSREGEGRVRGALP